ncbi:1,4-dihydroxy-2-naphthoate polyprenyltransferase [Mergibacter septicus]|uniref:1,4-dihydroxy-2-naphthoate polyprenyltransferase n=1 Tax=Mergibacter septicus TaxID=221402 RepID=UPI001179062E|nr:1,4-dihydroxy-2-naphthoate polyprenyltransferase [Mergibacter septicus]AWX14426.1 1,4-dihydroxy-2-naphthoate polyprenyltransferase [Mergibacter septicus]
MTQNQLKMWLVTARPKTLPLALASIMTGAALAYRFESFNVGVTLLAIITALLLQIVSNFANDYGDHLKGADTTERIGPLRGIQQGAITATQLKIALLILILLTLVSGSTLIIVAYHSIKDLVVFGLLGILAIIASITYTVGRKPYGYLGLGDISVLIFFGWLAVGGTFYLQAYYLNLTVFSVATASGLLATAVLNINNLRDLEQDKKVGKNTLAVRLGERNAKIYHLFLLSFSFLLYWAALFSLTWHNIYFLMLLPLPLLFKQGKAVLFVTDPMQLRPLLAQMAMLALLINVLFSVALILGFDW